MSQDRIQEQEEPSAPRPAPELPARTRKGRRIHLTYARTDERGRPLYYATWEPAKPKGPIQREGC